MANPYTRQSSFTDGDTITSALFNDEYDKLVLSFSSTVGHTHDGSTAEGAPITKLGPTQDVVIAAGSMLPKTNNTVDLGSSSLKFKDGYFAGNVTVDGVVTHSGNMIIGDAATDTLTINATIQGSSLIFEGATDNAHELTLAIPDATSDVTVTLPNATDTLVGKATTDTLTNKTLTSAVLNTGVSGTAVLDEDDMATDSATQLATQQSIKAYVDTVILTEDTLAEMNDTNITSPGDAALLLYDTGTSTWRDAAMSGDATIGDTGIITIGNDKIDSQHYAAGSIDNEHLADDAVDSDELAAGAVDIAHLSATGTAGATNFLRGDNSWVVPTDTNTNQLTTFTVSATTDTTPTTISQGDDLMFTAGTGITTETTADGTVTITNTVTDTNTMGSGFTVSATTDTTPTTITQGDDLMFTAGTGITTETTADGTVTITNTVTDTNTMGSGFTVSATTDTTPTTITQGDDLMIAAGTGITTETTADGTVTITNTVSGASTATSSATGVVKLEDDTEQTVAANTVSATAGKTYGIQLNSSDQAVVNVPWTDTDTVYTLPEANATTKGGIELFSNTDQSVAAESVSTTANRTYGLQLNSDGQGVVNVPWADTDTNTNQLTTFTVSATTDSNATTISQGDDLMIAAGTGITTETTADGTVTITNTVTDTNTMGSGFTVSATTDSNATTITQGDDLMFTAGTGIACETTADGTVTITNTVSDTNTMGSGFTVSATTDSNATTITQGDDLMFTAGTGITCETTADGTVTITNTVSDTNTTYTAGDGLDLTGTAFSTDLKSNGGVVIESTELAVDLGASSITGTLAVGDGGTGLTAVGSAGQLLTTNSGASAAEWADAPQGVSNSKLFYFGSFS